MTTTTTTTTNSYAQLHQLRQRYAIHVLVVIAWWQKYPSTRHPGGSWDLCTVGMQSTRSFAAESYQGYFRGEEGITHLLSNGGPGVETRLMDIELSDLLFLFLFLCSSSSSSSSI